MHACKAQKESLQQRTHDYQNQRRESGRIRKTVTQTMFGIHCHVHESPFPIPQPSVGKRNVVIFLSSSLERGRRPSCQPEAGTNIFEIALLGDEGETVTGTMFGVNWHGNKSLSSVRCCRLACHPNPLSQSSLSRCQSGQVFPTIVLFFSKWFRVMMMRKLRWGRKGVCLDTAVSMADTWGHPCTPAVRSSQKNPIFLYSSGDTETQSKRLSDASAGNRWTSASAVHCHAESVEMNSLSDNQFTNVSDIKSGDNF